MTIEQIDSPDVHLRYLRAVRPGGTPSTWRVRRPRMPGKPGGRERRAGAGHQVWKTSAACCALRRSYDNLVRMTTYLADMTIGPSRWEIRQQFLGQHRAASTLVGVTTLADPAYLIEVEAIAVIEQPARAATWRTTARWM